MKYILAVACLLLQYNPDPTLLVLDKNLKKPVHTASGFTEAQFLRHCFPVYASEKEALVAATDKAVKRMGKEPACHGIDTIATAHTTLLLIQDCDKSPNISVLLITKIEESQTSYGFTLVEKEESRRRAQQKLLNFATYLEQQE